MATFKAIVVNKTDAGQSVALTDFDENDLMEGDVTFRVEWSTLNYKDGLAVTGKAPVVRRFPMIAGIDFAGTVETSSHPDWKPGDKVILNGWGCGETHLGGMAEGARQGRLAGAAARRHDRARRDGDRHRRLHGDARRDGAGAPRHHAGARAVVVTGAAGGVGSVAVALLSSSATTSSPRPAGRRRRDYLQRARRRRGDRPRRSFPAAAAARQGALGRRRSIRSARPRSPMCCR